MREICTSGLKRGEAALVCSSEWIIAPPLLDLPPVKKVSSSVFSMLSWRRGQPLPTKLAARRVFVLSRARGTMHWGSPGMGADESDHGSPRAASLRFGRNQKRGERPRITPIPLIKKLMKHGKGAPASNLSLFLTSVIGLRRARLD
jgi:hypothetical protein